MLVIAKWAPRDSTPLHRRGILLRGLQQAAINLVNSRATDLARLGLRCGLGSLKQSYRQLLLWVHPDKVPEDLKAAATAAMKLLVELYNNNENVGPRKVSSFRAEILRFTVEENLRRAMAAFNGEPMPPPRQCHPEAAPADAEHPAGGEDLKQCSIVTEKVNLDSIERWMKMIGSRTLAKDKGITLFEMLQSIRARARPIGRGLGEIKVIYRQAITPPGLRGRQFTGLSKDSEVPEELQKDAKCVAPEFVGRSAFGYSKLVKYIARFGLDVHDVDCVNCYYDILCTLSDLEPLQKYKHQRDDILRAGMETYQVSRDAVKDLFLRIGFLGSYERWLVEMCRERVPGPFSDFVDSLVRSLWALVDVLKVKFPEVWSWVEATQSKVAKRPRTFLSHIFMHFERIREEAIVTALPAQCRAMGHEHDGVLAEGKITEAVLLEVVRGQIDFPIAIKPPPDLEVYVKAHCPEHLWVESGLKMSIDDIVENWQICRDAIRSGPPTCRMRAVAFGKILSTHLEGKVLIPTYNTQTVEQFDNVSKSWSIIKKERDELHIVARDFMWIFAPLEHSSQNFKSQWARVTATDPLLCPAFCNTVAGEAVLGLRRKVQKLDDPEMVRHKVLFACGTLYDFATNSFRTGRPDDRIHRHSPWTFAEPTSFPPDLLAELNDEKIGLFASLKKFYKGKGTSLGAQFDGTLQFLGPLARRIIELLDEAAKYDECIKFLLSWTWDYDETVYWILQLTRGMSSHPRFTEAAWIHGAANGGKDRFLGLVHSLAGTDDDGLLAVLSYTYVTTGSGWTGKEGCAPFLRACEAARFIEVSEVPALPVTMTTLKGLCEQRGALVAARGLYETGHGFRPMALPIITSNFQPKLCVTEASDTGAVSRLRVFSTPHVFTMTPTLPTEKRADPALGDKIMAGKFNSTLFWLMRGAYPLLDLSPDARNIGPLPLRIEEETQLCFQLGKQEESPFNAFVATLVPVTAEAAVSASEFYTKAADACKNSPESRQIRALMSQFGIVQDRVASKRFYRKLFPGLEGPQPIGIEEKPVGAAP